MKYQYNHAVIILHDDVSLRRLRGYTQPHPARTEFRVSRDLSFFTLDL